MESTFKHMSNVWARVQVCVTSVFTKFGLCLCCIWAIYMVCECVCVCVCVCGGGWNGTSHLLNVKQTNFNPPLSLLFKEEMGVESNSPPGAHILVNTHRQ